MTPSGVKDGLAAALATITGLRVFDYVPDGLAPPAAVIEPLEIDYDSAMHNGLTFYRAYVLIVVGRMSDRTAQNSLDQYVTTTGASSVKAAIEADRSLGGACQTLRVTSSRPREALVSGVEMLAYRFEVTIYG